MSDCKETVKALQKKVAVYEEIIEAFTAKARRPGVITAGPFTADDKVPYYRVDVGGDEVLANLGPMLKWTKAEAKAYKVGAEVVVIENTIVEILPEPLKIVKQMPDFKLIGWDSIGGLKSQIDRIRTVIELPINNPALVKEFGLPLLRGVLLYGPPGCGKTIIAKAIASTILNADKVSGAAFTYVKGPELLSRFVGAAESAIRNLFDNARGYSLKTGKQAIIFIDEAEAILPRRGSRLSSDVDSTIVPMFLAEMDGLQGHHPFIILSTNLENHIDEAVLRPGRIDLKIRIDRPSQEDAVDIFNIHLESVMKAEPQAKLSKAATDKLYSNGIRERVSGALIEGVCKAATGKAIQRYMANPKKEKKGVTATDIIESIDEINHELI